MIDQPSKEEMKYAEQLWQKAKTDAPKDPTAAYLCRVLEEYYPGNRDAQVRLMGFINEVCQRHGGSIDRDNAWELARKWQVEKMLAQEETGLNLFKME